MLYDAPGENAGNPIPEGINVIGTRRRVLGRLVKAMLYGVAVLLTLVLVFLITAWVAHDRIVHVKPGQLNVSAQAGMLGKWVNPFIGTGGIPWICGNDFPGATLPFGRVRLSLDTASILVNKKAINLSGYYYGDTKIVGFSHTRLAGTGVKEGGNFRLIPTRLALREKVRARGWCAKFSHADEVAFPGYYAVKLAEPDVLVELTASMRAGVHRYTFAAGDSPRLLLDVSSALDDRGTKEGTLRVLPEAGEIEGSVLSMGGFAGRYGGLKTYFVARVDKPFSDVTVWNGKAFIPGGLETSGDHIGVDMAFAKTDGPLTVQVSLAISFVSLANARQNLETEVGTSGFDVLAAKARDAWETALARIRVEGGTDEQMRVFYTGLYHAMQMPTTFTDSNGEFVGFDKAVHKAEGWCYYTDLSLWDTFRTVHPLFTIIAQEEQRDMMRSLVAMRQQGGWLPRWPSGEGYTNSMFGTPADIVIAESYLKGIRDFDVESAYEGMKATALAPVPQGCKFSGREGIEHYLKYGYCPADLMKEAVSRTLEFAYSDHAIALLAEALGRKEDAALFLEHAHFYTNLWDLKTQYFQPRNADGLFVEKFKPLMLTYMDRTGEYTNDYVEGSALQWRWGVFHDPEGLISLFGNPEHFVDELNAFFASASDGLGDWNPGPYYWHGNEPDIHAAYLFNEAGRPDLTQKWVRWILDHKYAASHDGLDGNDDCGTLSAWYVLSALGIYPVAGTDKYELGAPLFRKAEIRIGANTLHVVAANYAPENCYVKHVWLNDVLLDRTWFKHAEIAGGGTLRFEMEPTPNVPVPQP